ncbi:DUF1940 domain-containing protein [Picrophilus oshimae]|uniref:Uncharacterized protein n=1 Tax=Picrophilus torridus (strain ATCC 700027 / DSM 9790 / JCM 10055 / NBRC 100828 / KAW 2/3) TaxID=1122961 RepID=Q6L129_PICTO|nr:DUF1940 domain-containing protein [Picrophilus oshimae]AAT43323.1 hypothetical protein PTO0738 [Picrophilus oshimae DSM 9789]SMD30369.1 protein of unknown function [Picrophilus oshimae DSM 9789]
MDEYCDIIDDYIDIRSPYFAYREEINLTMAFLGLAVSEGSKVPEIKECIDILDVLTQHLYDKNVVLKDSVRKSLNHEDESWLDITEKMENGNKTTAYMFAAAAHLRLAINYITDMENDERFKDFIDDYTINYMLKLVLRIKNTGISEVLT